MKKLILALLVPILLIAAAGFVYFQFLTPESKAKNLADTYMKALLANDTTTARNLYSSQTPSPEITQRNYRLISSVSTEGRYYVLYEFSDDSKPALLRIAVNNNAIETISQGSSLGSTPREDKPEENTQVAIQPRCLQKSDLEYIDSTSVYARNIRGATMVFPSESTEYVANNDTNALLERMANFYKRSSSKDFVFELSGYRQNTGLTDEENDDLNNLFQKRAVALQNELVARDVPLDRVLINDRYTYYIPEQSSALTNERYVDINIVNRCIKE